MSKIIVSRREQWLRKLEDLCLYFRNSMISNFDARRVTLSRRRGLSIRSRGRDGSGKHVLSTKITGALRALIQMRMMFIWIEMRSMNSFVVLNIHRTRERPMEGVQAHIMGAGRIGIPYKDSLTT